MHISSIYISTKQTHAYLCKYFSTKGLSENFSLTNNNITTGQILIHLCFLRSFLIRTLRNWFSCFIILCSARSEYTIVLLVSYGYQICDLLWVVYMYLIQRKTKSLENTKMNLYKLFAKRFLVRIEIFSPPQHNNDNE